jgi:hypothetical protein
MSQRNRVSVILPISDADEPRKLIALRSLLVQSHRNFELIIPALQGQAVEALTANFPDDRVKIIPLELWDAGLALKAGLAVASGAFVALADATTVYLRHRLELQLRYFERYPETDVLFAPLVHPGAAHAVPNVHDPLMLRFLMLFRPLGTEGGLMFRKKTAPDHAFPIESLFQQRSSLAFGVLPSPVGTSDQLLPSEIMQAIWAIDVVQAQYGDEAAQLARVLRTQDATCAWEQVMVLEKNARQLVRVHKSRNMAYAASFDKAVHTALFLFIQDSGLRGWIRHPVLYNTYFRAAVPWKSKWRTALF